MIHKMTIECDSLIYKIVLFRSTTLAPTEAPEQYQTTRTNYNYHPIMEYFASPQPLPSPEVRTQDVMQRKSDLVVANNDFHTPRNGWTPMTEEFGPRNLH